MAVSFEDVYKDYYTPVYRYLLSLSKNDSVAEEITQETFFKALKNIEKYDSGQKMLTWLCTIAKNTYFTKVKKSVRFQELGEDLADTEDNLIDRMIDSDASFGILKVMHKLSEPYKEVFSLRVLGELSFKKIGEIFGKTEAWARVTYYRSKVMIKEMLENE